MRTIANLSCLVSGSETAPRRLILLHGRGASPDDLYSLKDELPEGYAGIFPQGPLPFPPGPNPFGWAWFGMPPDQRPGLESSSLKLRTLLDEITQVDPARAASTILGGFSQGAVMALDVGLSYRPKLGGVLAMSGYLFDEARSFAGVADGDTPPVCMVHGIFDDVLPVERGRWARDILLARKVPLQYQEFEMAHASNGASWAVVRGYLAA